MQVNANRDAPKRNAHCTKAGPGRRHVESHKRASPVASKGAPFGFELHTNPERAARRKRIAAFGGSRQFKRLRAYRNKLRAQVAA